MLREYWTVNKAIGLMIDQNLSFNAMQHLREALTLQWDVEDKLFKQVVLVSGAKTAGRSERNQINMPSPIPPRCELVAAWIFLCKKILVPTNEDGTVTTFRYLEVATKLIQNRTTSRWG